LPNAAFIVLVIIDAKIELRRLLVLNDAKNNVKKTVLVVTLFCLGFAFPAIIEYAVKKPLSVLD